MPETKQKVPAIKPEKIVEPKLSDKEKEVRTSDIYLMCNMRDERDRPHEELDGMTYIQYYESNRKKDLSYLPPKRNRQDVRITSGLTREKDTTLLSTALNMNFVPDVTAFDSDDLMVAELGDNMADHVKKSREIEDWESKRPIIYRELISQGDVFVQEVYEENFKNVPLSKIDWNPSDPNSKIQDFDYKSRFKKVFAGCQAKMIQGPKVYLGSIRIENIKDQDEAMIVDILSRTEAYKMFATWERWENVPTSINTMSPMGGDAENGQTYQTWNLTKIDGETQVGMVILFLKAQNRVQIYLNGVPMLPHNFPLSAISPDGDIPMAQGKLEPISNFAYSKSQPSKLKIDQEVLDETTKLMIDGMRQGRKPPKGSRKKKVYSKDIFVAGKITPDIREGDLFDILSSPGLNAADFSFYKLIRENIEDKSVNKAYEGDSSEVDTLGQAQQDKEQQMLKLGLALDGFTNLERRLTWLRIYNILANWTTKYDPDLGRTQEGIMGSYRNFSVKTTLDNGQSGVKNFRYTTDPFPSARDQQLEERDLTEKNGVETRIVYMNPELMRSIKYKWFIIINPTPQSNDKLSQILFIQNIRNAIELFGPESLNLEYVKQRFAILINEDYNKFFRKVDIMELINSGYAGVNGGAPADNTGIYGGAKSGANAQRKTLRAAIA